MKLQLMDSNNKLMEEKELLLGVNDTLVMKFPDAMTLDEAYKYFVIIQEGLKGDLVGIPSSIELLILKKEIN